MIVGCLADDLVSCLVLLATTCTLHMPQLKELTIRVYLTRGSDPGSAGMLCCTWCTCRHDLGSYVRRHAYFHCACRLSQPCWGWRPLH